MSTTSNPSATERIERELHEASTHPGQRLTVADRAEIGKAGRKAVPRSAHAELPEDPGRDPLRLVLEQDAGRLPWLVPVRHGRMAASPFAFFRGAARVMASDLAATPASGLRVQLAGDAHLANFGVYASPERRLVFDQNDFDETLPGPWEWDLKRLAASVAIAGRHRKLPERVRRTVTAHAVAAYRVAIARFAGLGTLELWYDHLDLDTARQQLGDLTAGELRRLDRFEAKARGRDSLQALRKLAVEVEGEYRIRDDPPTLYRLGDLPMDDAEHLRRDALHAVVDYAESLSADRRHLLGRFTPIDVGVKAVGVGSVGTRCLVLLLEGRDRDDPLFLQIKEATASVLEEHLEPSAYDHPGRRVVEGQRLIQATTDILLGWVTGPRGHHYYVRQLRDWKGSADLESIDADTLQRYAELCGWTLARGHARSGDPVAIAAYCGTGSQLDRAITEFAEAYATRNARDHQTFVEAIADGQIEAEADG